MAAITGQPAPKPSQIGQPVPGQDEENKIQEILASFDAPEVSAPEAVDAGISDSAAPVEGPAAQDFAPEPGFMQANVEQFGNVVTRIQAGLAANDQEKLNFLRQKYGAENAVIRDGKLYFRKNPKDKLKRLDPDTLELINDILPDFSREVVTEAAMLPGEVGGAMLGGVPGALGGRVASVPLANAAADKVAELAGVPQDEARSRVTENLVGMGVEAVAPVVGRRVMKLLPGSAAYKAAKEAGEREIIALSKQSQEVAQAVESLAQQGIGAKVDGRLVGLPGAEVSLMGHHLHPDSPILLRSAAVAANDPRFINAQNQLAEDWGASLKNTLVEIGRKGNPGPLNEEQLASRVTNAVADLQRAEGQAIGKYRAQAIANLKNQRIPLDDSTRIKIKELLTQFGFRPRIEEFSVIRKIKQAPGDLPRQRPMTKHVGQKWLPPKDLNKDVSTFVGTLGLTSKGVVNNLIRLSEAMDRGIRITDLEDLRNAVGSASDSLYRTPVGAKLGSISGDLRKTYNETIEKGLVDDFDKAAFRSTMSDFSQLKMNIGTLKSALNEESSARAIVKNFFTGKENLQKIKAIKQISPESFGALKEEWVNQLLIDYGSRETKTGFKSSALLDALEKKYGDEFINEVMGSGSGPDLNTIKNIARVTERIELMTKGATADKMSEAQKKAVVDAGIGLIADIKFKVMNGVTSLMTRGGKKDSALFDILTRDGIDKYVANYPGKIDKKGMVKKLTDALAEYKIYRSSLKAVESAGAKRAVKRAVISDVQEGASNLMSPVEE